MNKLARKLHLTDYFSLAFGVMIGVGWLVVMDDWLLRGGPVGALLGFAIGALMLLPVGWVYGRLVTAIPDAAGEVAYTAKVFPEIVSFATAMQTFEAPVVSASNVRRLCRLVLVCCLLHADGVTAIAQQASLPDAPRPQIQSHQPDPRRWQRGRVW